MDHNGPNTITPPVSSFLVQAEDADSSILYADPWNTTRTVPTQPNFYSTLQPRLFFHRRGIHRRLRSFPLRTRPK